MKERRIERVRHELKFRIATVSDVSDVTPRMRRITLTAPGFADFASDAFDDHVKLFFPGDGEEMVAPIAAGPTGLVFPGGRRPPGRDYTPRRFDRGKGEVTIDFVLHGDGPAASWAARAKTGDTIGVAGPRASFVTHGDFDWYLLVGDETALPAIARRLEELPAGARVFAFIEIADAAERQQLTTGASLKLSWIERNGTTPGTGDDLLSALRAAELPNGACWAFIAGEATMAKAIRAYLIETRRLDPDWVKAAGYWHRGTADFYDGHAH